MVTFPTAATAEILADLGFDWLFLDAEHSALSYGDIQGILQAVGDRCLRGTARGYRGDAGQEGARPRRSRHHRAAG